MVNQSGSTHTVELDADTHQCAQRVSGHFGLSISQFLPQLIQKALEFVEEIIKPVTGGGGSTSSTRK
jgi:predicted ATP-grasp superfamily ATP-dependent carboligase